MHGNTKIKIVTKSQIASFYPSIIHYSLIIIQFGGVGSSVGIAIDYGLDGLGIEFQ